MYINFWYPICTTAELAAAGPVKARVLTLPFVAFRDADGQAHVLSDTCVHRGGALSKGRVVNGRVACPYHGWQFDGSGRCALIPSLGADGQIPARAKVDSYPVVERYGIVFAFLGDLAETERPAPPGVKEYDQPGWRAGLVTFDINAYFERSIENGLDPVHNEFVHALQGNIKFRPDRMQVTSDEWSSTVFVRMDPPKKGTTQLESLRDDLNPEHFSASSGHYGANTLITRISLSKDNVFVQYFFEQPIDDSHTRIFFLNMRNCMLEEQNDARMEKINLAIADEDIAVITKLNPVRTPESSAKEVLVVGDECIGQYRRHLGEWERRGWRLDMKALKSQAGDMAWAIPSPARRTEKNWVLDAAPLVAATSRSREATSG
ncbi:MAG: aromatic ring-hydroxylating dioxygenase subunit alpha [Gammaproteobacteria bacterium]|nr:aromatic ring-hydroxylating dioxygenase subunit alpha [Gammaproteobacteria bacterium]